jgi:hypothetical protein
MPFATTTSETPKAPSNCFRENTSLDHERINPITGSKANLGKLDSARALGTRGLPGRGSPGWWAQAPQAPCQRARPCATSGLYCLGCHACWLHLFPLLPASRHLRRNTSVSKAEPICTMIGGSVLYSISACFSEHEGLYFIGDRKQAYLALSVDGGCPYV